MNNRWAILAVVFIARTATGFQFQAVASVVPLMIADLPLSCAEVGALIVLYVLPGAFFSLPGSLIGRHWGERRLVLASLVLLVVGGLITASANGFASAAAGRL